MLLAWLVGCGGGEGVNYVPVDLQLDVVGTVPVDIETIHMCVEGSGELTEGAGNGRVMFAGLRADDVALVTLDFRDVDDVVIGGVGPVEMDNTTAWLEAPQDTREDGCTAAGSTAEDDAESWVLGVRFTGEVW